MTSKGRLIKKDGRYIIQAFDFNGRVSFEINFDEIEINENNMTVQEREEFIRSIFEEELIPLLRAKGHDYSGNEDCMSNLRDFGWKGIVVRIGDKYHRLKNFCHKNELQVKDESVEDTLRDMINYGFLALILFRSMK